MNIFRRIYFIYPEIQKPLIKIVVLSLIVISAVQCVFIYSSMKWLESIIQSDLSIIVDYRVVGPWKNLLYLSILLPIAANFFVGLAIILYISNRFAGPLYRLERELDLYLSGQSRELKVTFRKKDYLKALAEKINRLKLSQ